MPSKQRTTSRAHSKLLKKQTKIDYFIKKVNDENQTPITSVLGKNTCTERTPLSESNGSNDTSRMPETPASKVTEHREEDRVKEFSFNFQKTSTEYVARGKLDENLYSVLMASEAFKEAQEKNEGKEFHFIGKREFTGAVNLGMPCKCLPENAHFEVIFYRDNREMHYRADDPSGKECVIFHIRSTGKLAGRLNTTPKCIIKSKSLRGSGHDLCVYAFAGETIREALSKDGRFLPINEQFMWNLFEGQRCIQFNDTVNALHNKHFEVQLNNKRVKAENKADSASPREKQQEENVPEENELLRELTRQVDQSLGKGKGIKYHRKQWNLFKEEFGKITSDGVPIIVHEMLVQLSGTVGFIKWNNNGNEGTASCFHLCNGYILTCHHVVKMIVGDGVPENEWEGIIEKSTKINFTYNEDHPTGDWYEVMPWFKVYCPDLDYTVLRLKGSQLPPDLLSNVIPPPRNGVVYIIGHPKGDRKSTDTCIVIPFEQRNIGYYMQLFSKFSFREIQNPDRITYNSCFFHGASGSPVFDSSGQLVGMHTGGYMFQIGSKVNSVIEFGPTIKSIAAHMEKHHPEFERSLFRTHQNETQGKQNVSSNDQEEVPMDVE